MNPKTQMTTKNKSGKVIKLTMRIGDDSHTSAYTYARPSVKRKRGAQGRLAPCGITTALTLPLRPIDATFVGDAVAIATPTPPDDHGSYNPLEKTMLDAWATPALPGFAFVCELPYV